ncbi:hypothetical protein L195_g041850 [Trifolium pratense]|uniref:Uncharacterized protein n=1 Tax=Trifolium pratense TaxID=57577 RepID=A0A2K3M4R6_TRIPR|nr:hypothetical protein L195_g041850 [Trifolium pratense]
MKVGLVSQGRVYNISIDGEEGIVKVTGRVNPNTLLSVLEKYGKHAELKHVKFEGEVIERNPNSYGEYGYNPYDGMAYSSYPPPMPCHPYQGYHDPYYPHFSQPPYPPPPVPYQVPYQFPPPPPSAGPFWAPSQPQPPPPPPVYSYGPPPPVTNLPPQNVPAEETSSRPNRCAMM